MTPSFSEGVMEPPLLVMVIIILIDKKKLSPKLEREGI